MDLIFQQLVGGVSAVSGFPAITESLKHCGPRYRSDETPPYYGSVAPRCASFPHRLPLATCAAGTISQRRIISTLRQRPGPSVASLVDLNLMAALHDEQRMPRSFSMADDHTYSAESPPLQLLLPAVLRSTQLNAAH